MAISDRYEALELLQKTPTGDIFRAKHTVLGRPVLIRTLERTQFDKAEIAAVREAVTRTAQLIHPNILSVVDAEFDDEFYYVTDNVVDSLKSRMARAPFDAATVARWGLQLLRAIAHAHTHNVVHCGISPWRVHFDQVGTVLLADFGLMTALKDKKTGMLTFEADATPYLPVGVLRNPGSYSERADRYGIAALISEFMTGAVPEGTRIDTRRAKGSVTNDVIEGLSRLLSGRGTADDVGSATDAFKAWVDALGPLPSESSSAMRAVGGPAPRPLSKSEGTSGAKPDSTTEPSKANASKPEASSSTTTKRRTGKTGSRKAASATDAKANADADDADDADADAAQADTDAAQATDAPGGAAVGVSAAGSEAERAQEKLNKYADLFAD